MNINNLIQLILLEKGQELYKWHILLLYIKVIIVYTKSTKENSTAKPFLWEKYLQIFSKYFKIGHGAWATIYPGFLARISNL